MSSSAPGATPPSTLERIEQVVRSLLNDEDIELNDESTAADVPGWDSLANVNILFGVEEEFGVQLADGLSGFETVGDLARGVDDALASRGGP